MSWTTKKIDVDDQLNCGRPHDYWILESLFYEIVLIFHIYFYCSSKEKRLRRTTHACGRPVFKNLSALMTKFSVEFY